MEGKVKIRAFTIEIIMTSRMLLVFLLLIGSSYAWLEGWQYRMPIQVIELSGQNITDHPVLVMLNSSNFNFSRTKPDGSDIRFTDANDTLLSYWIEDWNSTTQTAIIRVIVPKLLANENITIYLYYGNPLAESLSNQTAVCPGGIHLDIDDKERCWLFYEDFSTDVFSESSEWSRSNPSGVYVDISNGWLTIPSNGVNSDWAKYDSGKLLVKFSSSMDTAIEVRTFSRYDYWSKYRLGHHQFLNASGYAYTFVAHLEWYNQGWMIYNRWLGESFSYPFPEDVRFVRVRALFNSTHEKLYVRPSDDRPLRFIGMKANPYGLVESGIRGIQFKQPWDIRMIVDWVGIRKYAPTEPKVVFGSEQTQPPQPTQPVQLNAQMLSLILIGVAGLMYLTREK